jgi:hypothetical protein
MALVKSADISEDVLQKCTGKKKLDPRSLSSSETRSLLMEIVRVTRLSSVSPDVST